MRSSEQTVKVSRQCGCASLLISCLVCDCSRVAELMRMANFFCKSESKCFWQRSRTSSPQRCSMNRCQRNDPLRTNVLCVIASQLYKVSHLSCCEIFKLAAAALQCRFVVSNFAMESTTNAKPLPESCSKAPTCKAEVVHRFLVICVLRQDLQLQVWRQLVENCYSGMHTRADTSGFSAKSGVAPCVNMPAMRGLQHVEACLQ